MPTSSSGESAYQIHGYEFHGDAARYEVVLDVLGLFHSLLSTCLTVFTVHEYILLHTFPVVQSLECSICASEAIMTSVVMCQQQCCADQAVWEYHWLKCLKVVYDPSP